MDYTVVIIEGWRGGESTRLAFIEAVKTLMEEDEDWRPHGSVQITSVLYDGELYLHIAQAFVKGRLYAI